MEHPIELDGGALDVLYRLFWFGPAEAGEVPSKHGESVLQELKLARRINAPSAPRGKDTYLSVLTPAGYDYALQRFGGISNELPDNTAG